MKMMDEKMLVRYIMLTQIKGLGPVGQNYLLDLCGGIDRFFEMDADEVCLRNDGNTWEYGPDPETECCRSHQRLMGRERIRDVLAQRKLPDLREKAEEILYASQRCSIALITREDTAYPERFKGIGDGPVLLYVKGSLRINEYSGSVGIVGARRCTREGKEHAIQLGTQAVRAHQAVISGMAKGIDSYGHTAALKERGYTIAVTGTSPEVCYPAEHRTLYETIVNSGCIVSEYPPGTKLAKYMFPRRNRIIAGLSDELYVIDAGRNSGTKSTVAFCEKYGRPIVIIG